MRLHQVNSIRFTGCCNGTSKIQAEDQLSFCLAVIELVTETMLNPSAVAPGLLRWYSRHYLEGVALAALDMVDIFGGVMLVGLLQSLMMLTMTAVVPVMVTTMMMLMLILFELLIFVLRRLCFRIYCVCEKSGFQ